MLNLNFKLQKKVNLTYLLYICIYMWTAECSKLPTLRSLRRPDVCMMYATRPLFTDPYKAAVSNRLICAP